MSTNLRIVAALLLFSTLCQVAGAAQSVSVVYAGTQGDSRWQLDVIGTRVTAHDDKDLWRWSVSPSDGDASDCDGLTQLALLLQDANGDGRIDAAHGDRARLIVSSTWRNGSGWDSAVLALDLSEPAPPRRLWRQDSASLPTLARLVAEPAIAAVDIFHTIVGKTHTARRSANTDKAHFVVLLGAGLPTPATPRHKARDGAALLLLDAEDGHELWRAAASGTATQRFTAMTAGLSGGVTALDLNRDGRADRLYVGDAVATLWRFDIAADADAQELMSGGPIARLASAIDPAARSIVAAPDVALRPDGINVAVGTVYTGGGISPVHQGLFVLRDTPAFKTLTQAQYDSLPIASSNTLPGGYSIDTGSDGILGRTLTAAGALLYTQVEGDALNGCARPGTLLVKAAALAANTGASLEGNTATNRLPTPRKPRLLLRSDGSPTSPFDEPTALLDDIPVLQQLKRRYWRREDAD